MGYETAPPPHHLVRRRDGPKREPAGTGAKRGRPSKARRQARKEKGRLVEAARHDPEETRIHGDAEHGRDHAGGFDARLRRGFVTEDRVEHGRSPLRWFAVALEIPNRRQRGGDDDKPSDLAPEQVHARTVA